MVKVNNLCPADDKNPLCAQPAGESSLFLFLFFFSYKYPLFVLALLGHHFWEIEIKGLIYLYVYRRRYQLRPVSGQRCCGGPVWQLGHAAGQWDGGESGLFRVEWRS